jgi:nucleoside-diphosphate-sugar epimerase
MKILILGGAGYVGTRLCDSLITKGHEVKVIDHFWFGDNLNEKVIRVKKDLWKLDKEDLDGQDCVLFLAGLSNDPMAMFRPDLNFIENSSAPTYVAFLTKEMGIKRFICSSSCSVYGFTENNVLDEESLIKPLYPYGISKLQCELGVQTLSDDNFKPILFRKGTVGGWSNRMRYDLVVNTMVKSALTTGKIIVNNPNLWRPLIDIRDVVQGYEKAIESDLSVSGIFNLSGGNYTIGELGRIIQNVLLSRGKKVELIINNIQDMRNYKVSTNKIETELGFKSLYSPIDSVNEILDNIGDNYDFNNPNFSNIEIFKNVIENL